MARCIACGALFFGWQCLHFLTPWNGVSAVEATDEPAVNQHVRPGDSPQLGRSSHRNNVVDAADAPKFWDVSTGANIRWSVPVGEFTHGSPVIANGKVYIGTTNGGHLKRLPKTSKHGVVLCFRESDGQFLWQHSTETLITPVGHDSPGRGICSTPIVEGDRLWVVTNRGEVVCLDTEGFLDGEDDGDARGEWTMKFDVPAGVRAMTLKPFYQAFPLEFRGVVGAIAEMQGFGASSDFAYERSLDPLRWRAISKKDSTELFKIDLSDSALVLSGQGDFSGKQVRTPLDFFDGLDRAEISPGLRAQFLSHGYKIPDEAISTVIQPGRSWAVSASWQGTPVEFEIELILATLHCRQLPAPVGDDEADVVWSFDMMKELGVQQRRMANCAPTIWGDVLFVCTSNAADDKRMHVPAPHAPSFVAFDKHTGRVLWTDNSPGANILYGQWSSPAVGVFDGVAQVLFAGGDGWVYSFRADAGKDGKPEFLWKFDGNPKAAVYRPRQDGDRTAFIASPVIYNGLVYLSMGEDHVPNTKRGRIWCIDPTRQGDVSPELVVDQEDRPVPHRRIQPTERIDGLDPRVVANPNSAVVWQYGSYDDPESSFKTTLFQTICAPAIHDDLLIVPDTSGVIHALNARTGVPFWTCQLKRCWSSPLIVGNNVYVAADSGVVAILSLSDVPSKSLRGAEGSGGRTGPPLNAIRTGNGIYGTPAFANGVLYLATRERLLAIGPKD